MEKYGVNELRRMFLEFFEGKGHLVMDSFSLVPQNDDSLLLINAGMAPLKPYFTGQEIPPRRRVATCQKCIRTGDIDNVGKTARHGTFFEMLGNFSFGDYFKKEAIGWSWEFLTEVVGLDACRLYPSVYQDDDEAFEIWNKDMGIPAERIFRFGKEDNFWEHGAGPCGPCSEIYYDRGEKYGCGRPECTVGCDCDRYMEVWNNVFTQFENDGKGNYTTLAQKNIDTGMGLERLAVVVQDVDSIFEVDTIKVLLDRTADMAGTRYGADEKSDVSLRVITDHIRSCTFMISDGILPSNEGRGYVLRRLLRRAARHGRLLGIDGKFLAKLSETVIESSKDGYPELYEKRETIFKVLGDEEDKFDRTIDQGLSILADLEERLAAGGATVLPGADAFRLYDTFGFPLDLTKEILEEKGFAVDMEGFKAAMEVQRTTARNSRKKTNYMGREDIYQELDAALTTEFTGYTKLNDTAHITAITGTDAVVQELSAGETGTIITDATPFYATMGGQKADCGKITVGDAVFVVTDVVKLQGGKVGHIGSVQSGSFHVGDTAALSADPVNREDTCKNHSATHLLQQALRDVLGTHVEQAGSYVAADRLRFDFTHSQAMTRQELETVEDIVNSKIRAKLAVKTDIMSLAEARKTGAMALFGEKYGETVRVVNMGGYSVELCGGTHVENTSQIGQFKILSESGVAAGVRRIEALTGDGVIRYYEELERVLFDAAHTAKTEPANLAKRIAALQEEVKALASENEKLKSKAAGEAAKDAAGDAVDINGIKVLCREVKDADMNSLRDMGDKLKESLGDCVIVLMSATGGKVNMVAMATDGAQKKGAHAGTLIKAAAAAAGGGGGGRPGMAQAGGKNPAAIGQALEKALETARSQLS